MGKDLGPGQVNPNLGILSHIFHYRKDLGHFTVSLTDKETIGRLCSPPRLTDVRLSPLAD